MKVFLLLVASLGYIAANPVAQAEDSDESISGFLATGPEDRAAPHPLVKCSVEGDRLADDEGNPRPKANWGLEKVPEIVCRYSRHSRWVCCMEMEPKRRHQVLLSLHVCQSVSKNRSWNHLQRHLQPHRWPARPGLGNVCETMQNKKQKRARVLDVLLEQHRAD